MSENISSGPLRLINWINFYLLICIATQTYFPTILIVLFPLLEQSFVNSALNLYLIIFYINHELLMEKASGKLKETNNASI